MAEYNPNAGESKVLQNVMEVLGYKDNTSSYYSFDVTKTATTEGAAIRVGLKVFVPRGQNRETVSKQIGNDLKKKFNYELKNEDKNVNQLNVIIPNGSVRDKIIRLDIKPVSNPRGAKETAIGESAQCVYCRLRFTQSKDLVEPISETALTEAYNSSNVQVDVKIDDILALGADWKQSCILGANKLYNSSDTNWKGNAKRYTFSRGIGIDKAINEAYKLIKKNLEKQGEEDKWNPADIWMSSGVVNGAAIKKAAETTYPKNLNLNLISWYRSGDLMGISLKKMSRKPVKITQVNDVQGKSRKALMNDQGKFNPTPAVWADLTATAAGGGFKYGKGSDQAVTLRNFGGAKSANFQGEAKGVGAMGGKVKPGIMEELIKLPGFNTKFKLPDNQTVWRQSKDKKGQEKLAKEIATLLKVFKAKDLNKLGNDPVRAILGKTWEQKADKRTPAEVQKYIYSKYMTMKLLSGLAGIKSKEKRQECITDIFLYSNSQWTDSGFHLKLSD